MAEKTESRPTGDWFVRMSNGTIFGPINTKGLVLWVCDGRVMPDDEISADRVNWQAARELDALGMDTMIELPNGTFLGPYNEKAIEPLVREGKIPPRSKRFHISELDARMASRQISLFGDEAWSQPAEDAKAPVPGGGDAGAGVREQFEAQLEDLRRQAGDSLAESERELESLRAEFAKVQKKLDTAERALARERETATSLKGDIDKLLAERDELKAELAATAETPHDKSTLADALQQVEALTADRNDLRDRLAAVENERQAEAAEWQDKLAAAETALEAEKERRAADGTARATAAEAEAAEQKTQLDAAETEAAALRDRLEAAEAEAAEHKTQFDELESEYRELLDFSNRRDAEAQEKILLLSAETPQRPLTADEALGADRRINELENRLANLIRERDLLKDSLEQANARAATAARPAEGDIAIIKMFAEGALEMMKKTLESEKERNATARATSAELQGSLREEIDRLERVLARDPGEISRAEQAEQRNDRLIAKLQQEVESARRHHQADMARAEANEKAMEGRCKALIQKEALLREKLSRIEQRTADYDSLTSQLRRKESALLAAEKEFEETRQQWQIIQSTLQHRIEELESAAGLLFDADGRPRENQLAPGAENGGGNDDRRFKIEPWMRRMR
ncbi:MAG: hypothetical protein ACOX9C_03640 [Kiritimatiellia bacterium]|jgi:hypothetical protein